MATIGQQLLQPEVGWTRYDDRNESFVYEGEWAKLDSSIHYSNTLSQTLKDGDKVSFKFYGEKFRLIVYSVITNSTQTASIVINGVYYNNINTRLTANNTGQVLAWESPTLEKNKTHLIEIINNGTDYLRFDAIDIYGDGRLGTIDKTLILHNGQYKKFNQGTPLINGGIATPIMTSNTTPSGVASSSAIYTGKDAWRAFDRNLTYASGAWQASTLPSWLSYKFDSPEKIIAVRIKSRDDSILNQTPNDFSIQARNNSESWVDLKVISNEPSWSNGETRLYSFNNTQLFDEYRIYVTTTHGSAYTTFVEVEFINDDIQPTPPSWKTVSTTLPTSTQFIEEGMDSLTPILDRKVQNLNPQEMTLDSAFVGEGKLFRKSVDLNKYFDLRTITTETRNS